MKIPERTGVPERGGGWRGRRRWEMEDGRWGLPSFRVGFALVQGGDEVGEAVHFGFGVVEVGGEAHEGAAGAVVAEGGVDAVLGEGVEEGFEGEAGAGFAVGGGDA